MGFSIPGLHTRVNLSDLHLCPDILLGDSEYGTFDYPIQYKHATGDRLCCALVLCAMGDRLGSAYLNVVLWISMVLCYGIFSGCRGNIPCWNFQWLPW